MRKRSAFVTSVVTALALAIPATATATVYQYGCCSTSSGVTLKTTNGWLVRSSNNKNTPANRWYRLAGYYYDGTYGGTNYYVVDTLSQGYSVGTGASNTRQECTNVSGYFLVNVSCWTIE